MSQPGDRLAALAAREVERLAAHVATRAGREAENTGMQCPRYRSLTSAEAEAWGPFAFRLKARANVS
jgi:hypothetical protein